MYGCYIVSLFCHLQARFQIICEQPLLTSSCLSLRLSACITGLTCYEFSWNFILDILIKLCVPVTILAKIEKKKHLQTLYMIYVLFEPAVSVLYPVKQSVFLWGGLQTEVAETVNYRAWSTFRRVRDADFSSAAHVISTVITNLLLRWRYFNLY